MSSPTVLPTMTLKPSSDFIYDKRKEKWELLEEGCQVEGDSVLELTSFLLGGEDYVNGQVMRTRSLEMGGRTGQHHAERMLAQAKAIPVEWCQFYLVFPDTLWRGPGGRLFVPGLGWADDVGWELGFGCVGSDHWFGGVRVVRVCK